MIPASLPLRDQPADSRLVALVRPSPNHGERPPGVTPWIVLLHYTGMPDGAGAIAWLCDPRSQVSCHYVVEEDGQILQLVPEARRAWHAGRSVWAGETDINAASIGIEIINPGHEGGLPPYPAAQIEAVIALCRDIAARHAIHPRNVLAHSDVAPGRKRDPGEHFPWDTLHRAGIGLLVPPSTASGEPALVAGATDPTIAAFQGDLAAYGYGVAITGVLDEETVAVTRSFQLHFRRERVDGVIDASTRATLLALLAARDAAPERIGFLPAASRPVQAVEPLLISAEMSRLIASAQASAASRMREA